MKVRDTNEDTNERPIAVQNRIMRCICNRDEPSDWSHQRDALQVQPPSIMYVSAGFTFTMSSIFLLSVK